MYVKGASLYCVALKAIISTTILTTPEGIIVPLNTVVTVKLTGKRLTTWPMLSMVIRL